MYASDVDKSGGEYYTPQEVSELLTRITVLGKKEDSNGKINFGSRENIERAI